MPGSNCNESLARHCSLTELHHVGVVVPDIERAAADVERIYGLPVTLFDDTRFTYQIGSIEHTTMQRIGLSAGLAPHLELVREVPGSEIWTPTQGTHHLGFVVDDLPRASRELELAGAPVWMSGVQQTVCPAGATYHRDPLGQVIELLDRSLAAKLIGQMARGGSAG